jgi:hypothetical protein
MFEDSPERAGAQELIEESPERAGAQELWCRHAAQSCQRGVD